MELSFGGANIPLNEGSKLVFPIFKYIASVHL